MAQIKAFLIAWKWYVLASAAFILIGIGVVSSLSGNESPAAENPKRAVKVARVADLMSGGNSLSTVAEIRSVSEAKISPEVGGRIVRVNASLGSKVSAGQILAEIENASQRAAVLQAEGALDAAKAAAENQGSSLESAKGTAVTTLLNAYAAANSAIDDAIGQIYSDPESSVSSFTVSSRDTQALADIESTRARMAEILRRQGTQAPTLSTTSDLEAELARTEGELREVRAHLDTVLKALNAGVTREDVTATTISGYVTDVTAARSAIISSLASITSSRAALETARTNAEGGATISTSAASIKQAEGAYRAALANLEKTIIRTPISGTLNNFTIKLGDTVASQQQVAIVSNNAALEAVAYVTEEDRGRIAVGDTVLLEGDITGTVVKIAPALDPVTRRIEVRIGLPASVTGTLTNGQSVRVEFANADSRTRSVEGPLSIPITAIKMEASRTIVFLVQDGKLAASPITIGKLSGETVQVKDGLTPESEIVVDARGLKEGQEVTISGARD